MDRTKIYTGLAVGFAFLQTIFPESPILTLVCLTLASAFTFLKQRESIEVRSKSAIYTYLGLGVIMLGGVNDLFNIVHLAPETDLIIRKIVAAALGLFNIFLKELFPTETGLAIAKLKKDLKEESKEESENIK